MSRMSNQQIVDYVKEITVAMVSNSGRTASGENGKNVADFMQAIYDKLKEFNENAT